MMLPATSHKTPIQDLKSENTSICLDWLSLYCVGTIQDHAGYTFTQLPYSTRQFKKVYEIKYNSTTFATATAEPHSKIINPRAIIIKFENRFLYSRSARYLIEKFLRTMRFNYKSITRADIAIDFNRFAYNLNPRDFISGFVAGFYKKNGRGKFQVIGEQKQMNDYDYLAFGSRSTGKRIYLYNKSKELKQVKDKPHIKAFWERNGININKDVWRIEFSFKGSQNKKIDELTGEIEKIHWHDLFNPDKLNLLMNIAIENLFSFKINDGKQNKTRMPDLQLFNTQPSGIKLIKLPDNPDSTKSQRILLRSLVKEAQYFYSKNTHTYNNLHKSIIEIASKYNLRTFLHRSLKYDYQFQNLQAS